jgi:hypothetical protein
MLERDGDLIWSPYQMRNILAYVQKCETLRENARQKASAQQMLSKCSPNAQQMLSKSSISTTTTTTTEREREREREREKEKGDHKGECTKPQTYAEMLAKKLKKGITAVFEIPPELEAALFTWAAYRKESSKPITERSIKQLIKTYQGRAADLQRDVEHSITQGYQGLFAPNGHSRGKADERKAKEDARDAEWFKGFGRNVEDFKDGKSNI